MFKGQKANLDSVYLLSWAWREHQVITWMWCPWAQHSKGTFITDQVQLSDVSGEEELLVSIAKCLRMKPGEMEDIKINKRFPGLNLHPETPLLQVQGSFYSQGPHLHHFWVSGLRQSRWFSWFRDEGSCSAGGQHLSSCSIVLTLTLIPGVCLWVPKSLNWLQPEPALRETKNMMSWASHRWSSGMRGGWQVLWMGIQAQR